jgi:hypothetical protein
VLSRDPGLPGLRLISQCLISQRLRIGRLEALADEGLAAAVLLGTVDRLQSGGLGLEPRFSGVDRRGGQRVAGGGWGDERRAAAENRSRARGGRT